MAFIGKPERVVEVELPQRAPIWVSTPSRREEAHPQEVSPEMVPVRREVRQS